MDMKIANWDIFKMKIRQRGEYAILDPGDDLGELNVAYKLYDSLVELWGNGNSRICVDLNGAPIIDSSVIGTLVRFHKEIVKGKGELVIMSEPNRAIQALLNMQLGQVMRFVRTESELA